MMLGLTCFRMGLYAAGPKVATDAILYALRQQISIPESGGYLLAYSCGTAIKLYCAACQGNGRTLLDSTATPPLQLT